MLAWSAQTLLRVEELKLVLQGLELEAFGSVSHRNPDLLDLIDWLFDSEVVDEDVRYILRMLFTVYLVLSRY